MTGPFLIQMNRRLTPREQSQAQILWKDRAQWAMQLVSGGFDLVTEAKTPSPIGLGAGSMALGSCVSETPARKSWRGREWGLAGDKQPSEEARAAVISLPNWSSHS